MKIKIGKTEHRYLFVVFGLLIFSLGSCSLHTSFKESAEKSDRSLILVRDVVISDQDVLRIQAQEEPRYNVFKLSEPDRIIIDLMGVQLDKKVSKTIPGKNIIQEVKVKTLEDNLSAFVRCEVFISQKSNYSVHYENNHLVVQFIPQKAEQPSFGVSVADASSQGIVSAAATPSKALPLLTLTPPSFQKVELPVSPFKQVKDENKESLVAELPEDGLSEGAHTLNDLDSKNYVGKRLSLEFQDAEVTDILRLIADVSKMNIIISEEVKGKLTLKLVDVPWDQALDIVLATLGLDKVQHGNIIRVAPVEKIKREREVAIANERAAKELEPLRLKLFSVNYAKAEEISGRAKNLLTERGTVDVDPRTNTLIVKDIQDAVARVENLLKVLDTQTPQVRIESRIVQAQDTFARNLGIQWGPTMAMDGRANDRGAVNRSTSYRFPRFINIGGSKNLSGFAEFAVDALPGADVQGGNLGFRLGSVSNIFNLDVRLNYAETQSMARIISRPSVTVLNNKNARIIQGTKIPFLSTSANGTQVQFQDAGIEVNVTPQVTNDGSVILKVAAKSNEPGGALSSAGPTILVREAETEMLIKSGQTAVLGGVFKITERRGKGGVPGLMSIPILGWLFRNDTRSNEREETLIFITPYVLSDNRVSFAGPSSAAGLE